MGWAMLTAMKDGQWIVSAGTLGSDLTFFFKDATRKETERMLDPTKTRFVFVEGEIRIGAIRGTEGK